MKVVDIHPEELIDRLSGGLLSLAERKRLDLHLAQCSSCRFEIAVRADLAQDAPLPEERPQLTFAAAPPISGVVAVQRDDSAAPFPRSLRVRSRRRWPLAMLAAALVLSAGGAMAAVITGAVRGQWLGWTPEAKPAESSVRVSGTKPVARAKRAVSASAATTAPLDEAHPSTALPPSSGPSESTAAPAPVVAAHSPDHPTRSRQTELSRAGADDPRQRAKGALPADSAAASTGDTSAKREDAAALFAEANRARRDGNADRAVGLYRALQSRYPSSSESELSRALLAQLLLDRGNPEAALAGFDHYLAVDAPVLTAEALVGRARALEQLGKPTQAAAAWRKVQSEFPGSVHARLAEKRLVALGMR